LYNYLKQHPNCFMPDIKEPGYFSRSHIREEFRTTIHYLQSFEAYLALFRAAPENALAVGEASTSYLRDDQALKAINRVFPEAKVIICLRDPVELVSSYYSFLKFEHWEDAPTLEHAWRVQPERAHGRHIPPSARRPDSLHYAEVARIGAQVREAHHIFGRERVKIVMFEDISRSFHTTYTEIQEFLGLPVMMPAVVDISANSARRARYGLIDRLVKRPPKFIGRSKQALKKVLRRNSLGIRAFLDRVNTETVRNQLSEQLRDEMRAYFHDDVRLLSAEIGIDLAHRWGWGGVDAIAGYRRLAQQRQL
jgi:hypothetical protein